MPTTTARTENPALPLPNDKFDDGIVIASVWGNDMPDEPGIPIWALLLVLMPTPPYYRRVEIEKDGNGWKVILRQSHENIVPATEDYQDNGGDY